jgi:hypothetical protein
VDDSSGDEELAELLTSTRELSNLRHRQDSAPTSNGHRRHSNSHAHVDDVYGAASTSISTAAGAGSPLRKRRFSEIDDDAAMLLENNRHLRQQVEQLQQQLAHRKEEVHQLSSRLQQQQQVPSALMATITAMRIELSCNVPYRLDSGTFASLPDFIPQSLSVNTVGEKASDPSRLPLAQQHVATQFMLQSRVLMTLVLWNEREQRWESMRESQTVSPSARLGFAVSNRYSHPVHVRVHWYRDGATVSNVSLTQQQSSLVADPTRPDFVQLEPNSDTPLRLLTELSTVNPSGERHMLKLLVISSQNPDVTNGEMLSTIKTYSFIVKRT